MTKTKKVYIKDLRESIQIDPEKYARYDGKYNYLLHTDPKSVFSSALNQKRLSKVPHLLDYDIQHPEIKASTVAKLLKIPLTTAVSLLIVKGFIFNKSKDVWVSDESKANTEYPDVHIAYLGHETCIESNGRPQLITVCILGESLDIPFLKAINTFKEFTGADIHFYFKKRHYAAEMELAPGYIHTINQHIESVNYHFNDDILIDDLVKVKESSNVIHSAIKPLSGLALLATKKYFVVPHARQELEVTKNDTWANKSLMVSTGCVNILTPGHTKALAKVQAHGSSGAVVYDPKGEYKLYHVGFSRTHQQFTAYDTEYYSSGKVNKVPYVDTVYYDDTHASMIDFNYLGKTKRVCKAIKPLQFISGDVLDAQAFNYHEMNRFGFAQHRMSLLQEISITEGVVKEILGCCPDRAKFVMLSSNHELFITKFLSNPNSFKMLGKDEAVFAYRALAWIIENTYRDRGGIHYPDINKYLFANLFKSGAVVSDPVQNFNVLLKHHGCEYGIGRSLGTQGNVKAIIGHGHRCYWSKGIMAVGFAGIEDPAYQSGVNASSHGLATMYRTGKRSLFVDL